MRPDKSAAETAPRGLAGTSETLERMTLAIHTLLSMVSRSRVRSSMAASQFCMRISEASFPHRELKAFRSVEGTWKQQSV